MDYVKILLEIENNNNLCKNQWVETQMPKCHSNQTSATYCQ